MAPTEFSILSNFLLPPAPLPAVISLRQFTDLFPTAQRSDPQIAILYRELQHQRATDTDDVKRNIAAEVKRGEVQRREVTRARRREDTQQADGLDQRELQMEHALFGPHANALPRPEHNLKTVLPDMRQAMEHIESEIATIADQSERLLLEVRNTIGDLSDLRYGRFNRTSSSDEDLAEEVLGRLQILQRTASQTGDVG